MEKRAVSLCPNCIHCPEVVIEGEEIRIGEAENTVRLQKEKWNVLVDLIRFSPVTLRASDSCPAARVAAGPRRRFILRQRPGTGMAIRREHSSGPPPVGRSSPR